MSGAREKQALRQALEHGVPARHHDVVFGADNRVCVFGRLYSALELHVGEIELIARREYELGYEDGRAGREPRKYLES